MKKVMLTILLLSVITVAIAASVILNNVQSQTGKQPYDVKITKFEWTSNWGPGPVGVLCARSFNITLQNLGTKNIEELTVEVKLLANNSEIESETWIYGPGIIGQTAEPHGFDGKLGAGEIRELRGAFTTGLDKLYQASDWGNKTFKVRIMLDDILLYELPLPYL